MWQNDNVRKINMLEDNEDAVHQNNNINASENRKFFCWISIFCKIESISMLSKL